MELQTFNDTERATFIKGLILKTTNKWERKYLTSMLCTKHLSYKQKKTLEKIANNLHSI